ncbi:RNA polymerase, sigma-24 subunit, ECF subfamily protein [Flammeovirgaceae bacterium 311]|nr:RNA polymerase, sigma-24 subunit, ECF subfamily protein [Flammeovirgaceae bacterium 311]
MFVRAQHIGKHQLLWQAPLWQAPLWQAPLWQAFLWQAILWQAMLWKLFLREAVLWDAPPVVLQILSGLVFGKSSAKTKAPTEEEIIEGCRQGKPSAQEKLYNLYSKRMMAVCVRYTKSRFEAEDIFHEAFVKVFNNISKYKGEGSFEGWVRRIFVNTAINHYNKNRKFQKQVDYSAVEEMTPTSEDIVSDLSGKELLTFIDQLPDGYKHVFNLYVMEGYNHAEIGEMLQIAEGTSKSQLAKAKVYLKNILLKHSISAKC